MDLDTAGTFVPGDYGFDMAFGIGVPLDPTIGYYTVTQTGWIYETFPNGTLARVKL
jgi:hypothetical protein